MREIGSEFWLVASDTIDQNSQNQFADLTDFAEDKTLLFSGRTAIDYVIQDITSNVNSVYMPSYCCRSMLQPFIERNIKIEFYDVILKKNSIKYVIDYQKDVDVFFAISYFGYACSTMDLIIDRLKNQGIIVIEDITHRLLNERNYSCMADYYIASLRKWFPIISGGIAMKKTGNFNKENLIDPPNSIISKKSSAMKVKAEFIKDSSNTHSTQNLKEKAKFLELFSEFNNQIIYNYKNYKIDSYSYEYLSTVNVQSIKEKRIKNANIIYTAFKKKAGVFKLLFNKLDHKKDCPLFVPILVKEEKRDSLRNYLIKHDIFTPVHWPVPNKNRLNNITLEIYQQELSLICDQRYNTTDMERMVEIIKEF